MRAGGRTETYLRSFRIPPVEQLKVLVAEAAAKKSERQIVRYNEDYLLWSLLRSWRVERNDADVLTLTIDVAQMHDDAIGVMPDGSTVISTIHSKRFPLPLNPFTSHSATVCRR